MDDRAIRSIFGGSRDARTLGTCPRPMRVAAAGLVLSALSAAAPAVHAADPEPLTADAITGVYALDAEASAQAVLEARARQARVAVGDLPAEEREEAIRAARSEADAIDLMAFLDPRGKYEFTFASTLDPSRLRGALPSKGTWSIEKERVVFADEGAPGVPGKRFVASWSGGRVVLPALPGGQSPLFLMPAVPPLAGTWRLDGELTARLSASPIAGPEEWADEIEEKKQRLAKQWPLCEVDLEMSGDGTTWARVRLRQRRVEVPSPEAIAYLLNSGDPNAKVPESLRKWEGKDQTQMAKGLWGRKGRRLQIAAIYENGRLLDPRNPAPSFELDLGWSPGDAASLMLTVPTSALVPLRLRRVASGGGASPAGDLDVEDAKVWLARAERKAEAGDLAGARADAGFATRMAPRLAEAWASRARLEYLAGDSDAAGASVTRAIELDPRPADPYVLRAAVRGARGDSDGEAADLSSALERDPGNAAAAQHRGILRFRRREFALAVTDLKAAIALDPQDDYARFFLFLSRALSGDGEAAARTELTEGFAARRKSLSPDAWAARVLSHLEGTLSAEDLERAADAQAEPDREGARCEARFYAGMLARIRGRQAEAVERLKACLATMRTEFAEWEAARDVLTWP